MPGRPASRRREPAGDSKSVRTRRRIVDAAARVLIVRGHAGLRLSDVAEIAEVQAPSIYYYFPSREELIEEAVAVGLRQARSLVVEALETAPAATRAADRLDIAVEAHLRTLLTHSDHAAAAIRTVGQLPEGIQERFRAAQREYLAVWRELLDQARAEGDLDPDLDTGTSLMIVVGALNWTAEWWDPDEGSFDGVVAAARTLVRRGLAA